MADKQISDLTQAESIQTGDLFVLEQSGSAKKLTGQTLINWMTSYADGHGGIQSITWTTTGTAGNGRIHSATIHYADETTSTFEVQDGYKGDTGAAWYLHIKYSAVMPISDADMGDNPDDYIGVYSGLSATAPTHYTDYEWFKWKGEKGDTGDAARVLTSSIGYQLSSSGTAVPSGAWSTTIPAGEQGSFLWTRVITQWNDGTAATWYSVSRFGLDGTGSVNTVNGVSADTNHNVALTADDISTDDNESVQTHLDSIEETLDPTTSEFLNYSIVQTLNDTQKKNVTDALGIVLNYKDYTKTNISVGSDKYATVGNFYSAIGVPSGAYILAFNIRGWSGQIEASLAASSDGNTLYVMAPASTTISSLTVRVWYLANPI